MTTKRNNISIACCDLRSAFNTGSIFRTADAALLEKVYLCGYTPFPPHRKLERTSRGTHKTVPWEHRGSIAELITEKRNESYAIIAVETEEHALCYTDAIYSRPLMLVVGNEAHGLAQEVLDLADTTVRIPMQGHKNSLNVAVAAGIVVFEALKGGEAGGQ